MSSPPRLPVSTPPTGLVECFFFISLVVGLPFSSIFCQFWLFFLNCCCPSFGCVRERSVSTYASILAGSPPISPFNVLFKCHLIQVAFSADLSEFTMLTSEHVTCALVQLLFHSTLSEI